MMRAFLSLVLLCSFSTATWAIGGVWVLEIEYQTKGKSAKGFVMADYWASGYEEYIGKNAQFEEALRKQFENSESITIYRDIIDHEKLAEAASFPMHSFHLVTESSSAVKLKDIKSLALVKVWRKVAYMINVLTPLTDRDISWVSGKTTVEYPVGQDVGCRLEVHNFGQGTDHKPLVNELLKTYSPDTPITPEQTKEHIGLLQKLKEKHIVVVELCGC